MRCWEVKRAHTFYLTSPKWPLRGSLSVENLIGFPWKQGSNKFLQTGPRKKFGSSRPQPALIIQRKSAFHSSFHRLCLFPLLPLAFTMYHAYKENTYVHRTMTTKALILPIGQEIEAQTWHFCENV